jgi:hypothetical protein
MASATLASLTADIFTVTKRPDLVAATQLHLKNALIKAHCSDYFEKDVLETNFQFNTAASIYQLDYKSLIPRFRSTKYLTIVDPISLQFVRELKGIPVKKFMDAYGYIKTDVYYLAGTQIQIRLSDTSQVFGLGCYMYPDTTLVTPSWIADEIPFAIIYEAARTLFRTIGYDEQSANMEKLVAEAMREVTMVGITTTGE